MAGPQYDYEIYNNQPHNRGYTQEKLDKKAADGWHVHTAGMAFAEIYILWEQAPEGSDPLSYQTGTYNFQHAGEAREQLRAMVTDGWHVHTATLNFPEAYVLWEKGGSALANRITPHIVSNIQGGVQEQAEAKVDVPAAEAEVEVQAPAPEPEAPAPSATDALFGTATG